MQFGGSIAMQLGGSFDANMQTLDYVNYSIEKATVALRFSK